MASARNQEEEEFAEYLLPFVKITSEENAQEDFLRALLVVWFDRFPLQMTGAEEFAACWNFMQRRDQTSGSFENVLHRFSSLELRDSERGPPYRREAHKIHDRLQTATLRSFGHKTAAPDCRNWREKMTLEGDRAVRAQYWHEARARGEFPSSHQYRVAISEEEWKAAAESVNTKNMKRIPRKSLPFGIRWPSVVDDSNAWGPQF